MQTGGRTFVLHATRFSNGCFLSLSEGEADRLGATLLSVRTIEKTDTMTIIPSKYGGIFSSMLAQMVASITQGIAVVSLYLASEPDAPMMKTLIDEVRKLLAESAS